MQNGVNSAPLFVSVKEAARLTGVSCYFLRQKISIGQIKPLHSGSKQLLHLPSLVEYLERETSH